jgi:hypothetical protein
MYSRDVLVCGGPNSCEMAAQKHSGQTLISTMTRPNKFILEPPKDINSRVQRRTREVIEVGSETVLIAPVAMKSKTQNI